MPSDRWRALKMNHLLCEKTRKHKLLELLDVKFIHHDKQQKPDISPAPVALQGQSSILGEHLSGKQLNVFMAVFKMFLHRLVEEQLAIQAIQISKLDKFMARLGWKTVAFTSCTDLRLRSYCYESTYLFAAT